jgi:peroxiredoxin (alkyl hydroperoxide reductase subunit C)
METPLFDVPKAFVGKPAPDFIMPSTRNVQTLEEPVRLADYHRKWLVLVFYPLDFTFVCPTELRAFSERYQDFEGEGADVLGVSVDSVYTHRAWIKTPRERGGLGDLRFPLASDITHQVSKDYGVYLPEVGHTLRATFLIDPKSILRMSVIHDPDVGRSVDETLRALQAFKTGSLCPADWHRGQPVLAA